MGFAAPQMAMIGAIGQSAGAGMSAVGSYFSAATQKANANAQAVIAESNARMAERSAQSALVRGNQQVAAHTPRTGQLQGRQRAAQAANGVDLGVGSAAEVRASTKILSDIDRHQIEANAIYEAWGIRAQKVNYQNQALMARAQAKGIKPGMALAGSLLSSAGSVASSWNSYGKIKDDDKYDSIDALGLDKGFW